LQIGLWNFIDNPSFAVCVGNYLNKFYNPSITVCVGNLSKPNLTIPFPSRSGALIPFPSKKIHQLRLKQQKIHQLGLKTAMQKNPSIAVKTAIEVICNH